jgi:HEXXH motif-containing protein
MYLNWVAKVLRGILPLAPATQMHRSGSYMMRPGVIACSLPAPAEIISELLIHEASHQYFYMLEKLGSVDDGSDSSLYYSPARRIGRPLKYILMAYHAFANIWLHLIQCIEDGSAHAAYYRLRAAEVHDYLRQLEPPLMSSRALTLSGTALFQPLADRTQRKMLES